jgi:lipopolysaccharide/colanic/teichoic acid biosynthesis glycosyltransferase
MTITASLLLLILSLVWLVMALVKGEASGSDFWFKAVVIGAILFTFGLPALR